MKVPALFAITLAGLALAACAPRYYDRYDGYYADGYSGRGYHDGYDRDRYYGPPARYEDRGYDRDRDWHDHY